MATDRRELAIRARDRVPPSSRSRRAHPDIDTTPYATGVTETTIHGALTVALDAYERLGLLGEDIEDEWTYVTDLVAAWRDRLEAVDASRGDEPAGLAGPAIERVIDEVDRIGDPHRAIDWLSTFPQVVLLALGEPA